MITLYAVICALLGLIAGYCFGRHQHHMWMHDRWMELHNISLRRDVTEEDHRNVWSKKYP